MRLRNSWTAVVLGLTIMVLTGCRQKAAFSYYESVSLDGWGREDTIQFALGPVDEESSFSEMLGVRANLDFPFTNVSLVVEQEAMPSGTVRCDTLDIPLIDEDGIEIEISATYKNAAKTAEDTEAKTTDDKVVWSATGKLDDEDVDVEWSDEDNALVFTIDNFSGATLPSTGGIGTTLFYVIGGILVVAAGVLLITKKRMSREG